LSLRSILPDAFQGLESAHELTLRITHTSVADLPAGLLRYLGDVRFLALDLRSNQLHNISPAVLESRRQLSARGSQLLAAGVTRNSTLTTDHQAAFDWKTTLGDVHVNSRGLHGDCDGGSEKVRGWDNDSSPLPLYRRIERRGVQRARYRIA
ncbi:chaoptin-like, partial [Tropilaelaps mercedesae]